MRELKNLNLFSYTFFHERDVIRVTDDGLWTFNQQILLLKRMEPTDELSNLEMYEMEIWVRVYKLLVGFMNEKVANVIGNYLGSFVRVDPKTVGSIKKEMRLKRSGGSRGVATFAYERLPTFCFY
ncbi:hypothetical protein Scep_002377 [Stephania cephalantha]|uniref:DUF4283 domain-containing protein n=1 Tax=Stephania cephalantha TaxID=152367 RepID=A0AAP0Q8Q3_9MAGN